MPSRIPVRNVPWAAGGTKSMRGNYPELFTTGAMGATCVLYPPQTLGPCYAEMPGTREDISDGMTGLPFSTAKRGDGAPHARKVLSIAS